jgi:hypothetical protein
MAFETRLTGDVPECPVGRWAIGLARSRDGRTWTVDSAPLVSPTTGTYYSCVAAHPALHFDGRKFRLWFKAEQMLNVCANGATAPAWGCGRYTGIGYAWMPGPQASARVVAAPVLSGPTLGYPSVARVDDVWRLAVTAAEDIYLGSGTDPQVLTLNATPTIEPGGYTWSEDEMFEPVLGCRNTGNRYLLAYGGRTTQRGSITSAGWAIGRSADGVTWTLPADAEVNWTGDNLWRHFDVLRVGASDFLVWYTERDAMSRVSVRFAYTSATWDARNFSPRTCPVPDEWRALFR